MGLQIASEIWADGHDTIYNPEHWVVYQIAPEPINTLLEGMFNLVTTRMGRVLKRLPTPPL